MIVYGVSGFYEAHLSEPEPDDSAMSPTPDNEVPDV